MADIKLTAENLPQFIEVLGLPADAPLTDVMAALRALVMAEAGEPQPTEETPPEGEALAADPAPPAEGEPKEDEDGAAAMAAAGRLFASTGKKTFSEAIDETEVWRKSHLTLTAERAKLSKDREALESAERRELYGKLVELGAETPATLWQDPLAKKKEPVERLAKEPLGDLRKRVAALSVGRPKAPASPKPPAGADTADGSKQFEVDGEIVTLTARQLRICAETKADPQTYAAAWKRRGGK